MTKLDIIIIVIIALNTATINSTLLNYLLFLGLGVSLGIYLGTLSILTKLSEEQESRNIVEKIFEEIDKED